MALVRRQWASQVVQVGGNVLAKAGDIRDTGLIPGSGRPLEEGMAAHSRMLSRGISWTEEPGGLQFMGAPRVGHD